MREIAGSGQGPTLLQSVPNGMAVWMTEAETSETLGRRIVQTRPVGSGDGRGLVDE